ncbi:hypothetical protein [Henriciella marina]|uniref:hypothetical protein n=1 Tax=Henriciella marina TaxID=453851 RepID=UPI0012EA5A62|nr:hypothetical protein [Henriciella marina]
MKPLLVCLATLTLTGCTTVSMVSKQAIVETELTEQQSEVRQKAEAFETLAENEGWVTEANGISGLADMLFGGDAAATKPDRTYAENIAFSAKEPAQLYATVLSDVSRAADSLEELDQLAETLLQSGDVQRADLISFESALVTAQKSYRSFSEATGIVDGAAGQSRRDTEAALRELAATIDMARASADKMAGAYTETRASKPLS